MQDAFIDNSVLREEVIHKIVEVKVWDGKAKKEKKEKKPKKEKTSSPTRKKRAGSSGSESSTLNVGESEMREIKADKKNLKEVIKLTKQRIDAMGKGSAGAGEWFRHFDKDGNAQVDHDEFMKMLEYLGVKLDERVGIMLFRVFDRADQGSFGLAEFTDVISRRMRPNYKRIVAAERERYRMHGLDLKQPKGPLQPQVGYKT